MKFATGPHTYGYNLMFLFQFANISPHGIQIALVLVEYNSNNSLQSVTCSRLLKHGSLSTQVHFRLALEAHSIYLASVAEIPGAHKPDTSWWLANVANKVLLSPVSTFTTPGGKSDESTTYIRKEKIFR
jgi:hypothetical protein